MVTNLVLVYPKFFQNYLEIGRRGVLLKSVSTITFIIKNIAVYPDSQ